MALAAERNGGQRDKWRSVISVSVTAISVAKRAAVCVAAWHRMAAAKRNSRNHGVNKSSVSRQRLYQQRRIALRVIKRSAQQKAAMAAK